MENKCTHFNYTWKCVLYKCKVVQVAKIELITDYLFFSSLVSKALTWQ